jgi:hypothetical protein
VKLMIKADVYEHIKRPSGYCEFQAKFTFNSMEHFLTSSNEMIGQPGDIILFSFEALID